MKESIKWFFMGLIALALFGASACGSFRPATVWQCSCTWRCLDGAAPSFSQSQTACATNVKTAAIDAELRCEKVFPVVRGCRDSECSCNKCTDNRDVSCFQENHSATSEDDEP